VPGSKTPRIVSEVRTKKKIFLYPFMVGLYPVISLLVINATEITFTDSYRSIAVSFFLTGLAYLILFMLVRKPHKVALLATLVLILFFSYGHLHLFLEKNQPLV